MEDELLAEELALLIEEFEARNPGQRSPLRDMPAPKPQVEVMPSIQDVPAEAFVPPTFEPSQEPEPELVEPESRSFMDTLKYAMRPASRFGWAALGETAALPTTIGSLVASLPGPASRAELYGLENPDIPETWVGARPTPEQLSQASEDIRKASFNIPGLGEEAGTPLEYLGELGGRGLNPAGKLTAPLSALTAGAIGVSDLLQGKSPIPEQLAGLLSGPAQAETLEETLRKNQGKPTTIEDVLRGNQGAVKPAGPGEKPKTYGLKQRKGSKNVPAETDEEFAARVEVKRLEREQAAKTLSPTAERIIADINKQYEPKDSNYWGMGTLVATTAASLFLPKVFKKMNTNTTPKLRPVEMAAPGTMDISTPTDLLRTYDEAQAGAIRLAQRAGVAPKEIAEIQDTFRIQTRGGAHSLTDPAVALGHMETPTFRFQAPVALHALRRASTPEVEEYLKTLDAIDQLHIETQMRQHQLRQAGSTSKLAAAGPPKIAGMDIDTALARQVDMEAANPVLKKWEKAYKAHVQAVRKAEADGEYAIRPTKYTNTQGSHVEDRSVEWLNAQRPREVPWEKQGGRNKDMPLSERLSPWEEAEAYTRRSLRHRMENEAVGSYVDAVRKVMPELFVEVTAADLARNPAWKRKVVSFYRRGQLKHYSTGKFLADTLNLDPMYMMSMPGMLLNSTKRILEFGTTHTIGAPAFAFTSLLRNWQIGKLVTEGGPLGWHGLSKGGFTSPSFLGSMKGIGQQLYPQMAKAFSDYIDHGSSGWIKSVFGQKYIDGLAVRAARAYDHSLYHQLQSVGTHRGSVLEHQYRNTMLDKASQIFQKRGGPAATFWNGWKATFEAIHNGPAFDFVSKNLGRESIEKLALRSRRLTGDPRTGGVFWAGNTWRPIGFEGGTIGQKIGGKLAQVYGGATELGRTVVPWWNPTTQGIKRIGEAWLRDPVLFTRNMWLYTIMPASSLYYFTEWAGKDPNGVSYVDYMMNRRSSYNRQMNWYIPIPGLPAEEGIEIPGFHEMMPVKRLSDIAHNHLMGSNMNLLGDDLLKAAHATLDTAVDLPMSPIANVLYAHQGMVGPMGMFGGEAYKPKGDPFDQTGGMPPSLELYSRAIAGSLAQMFGEGYAALTNTKEGYAAALKNAATQMTRFQVQRAPLVRDAFGIKQPISGNTDVTKELFEKQREIDGLIKYYEKWTKSGGAINTKPASPGGEAAVVTPILGGPGSSQSPGIDQPPPRNDLYDKFAQQVYERFKKENPNPTKQDAEGAGIGFKSMWRRYGDATERLRRLNKITDGHHVTWQTQLDARPEVKEELQKANVDTTNLRQVKNYYQKQRQDAGRLILYAIRAVENDFSRQWGRPITLKDLDPYKGQTSGSFIFPELVEEVVGSTP